MKYLLMVIILLTACSNATATRPGPVLHISNVASEAVAISYRPAFTGGSWISAGTVPANMGHCVTLHPGRQTTLLARGVLSGTMIMDSADLSLSTDWRWDIDVIGGMTQLAPIPTVCG